MELTSSAFAHGEPIPRRYSCEGDDVSPALRWTHAPTGTRSYALTLTDPDAPDPAAPTHTYVHWVLYDIPAGIQELPEAVSAIGRDGVNDWGRSGYGGPCPRVGRHRYVFTLYAVDSELGGLDRPTRAHLERALEGHVLARAELAGTYQKSG